MSSGTLRFVEKYFSRRETAIFAAFGVTYRAPMIIGRAADAVVVLDGSRVTFGEHVVALDELIAGTLDKELIEKLNLVPFTEAIARAVLARDHRTLSNEPIAYRPSAKRIFGGGRGGSWVVWIFGRTVRVGGGHDYDESFETFFAKGFPPAIAEAIGPAGVAEVRAGVLTLAPYECMCDSGADTPSQHGTYEIFAYKTDPRATVECNAKSGRCTVCNRGWTWTEDGDPSYEMYYAVTRFQQHIE